MVIHDPARFPFGTFTARFEGEAMKLYRSITIALVFVFIFLGLTPAPAFAMTENVETGARASTTLVSLTIENRGSGPVLITLESSSATYLFYAGSGSRTYQIVPGTYTYTVRFFATSMCKNWLPDVYAEHPLVKLVHLNGMNNKLGPYFGCNLK
jgi:hypothetical protein